MLTSLPEFVIVISQKKNFISETRDSVDAVPHSTVFNVCVAYSIYRQGFPHVLEQKDLRETVTSQLFDPEFEDASQMPCSGYYTQCACAAYQGYKG